MAVTSRVFAAHGRFCARHPWEVIVTTLTLTLCILSVGDFQRYLKMVTLQADLSENQAPFPSWGKKTDTNGSCGSGIKSSLLEEYNAVDVIVMTLIRCVALLYTYHRLRTLHRLQSRYILGIAGLFTVFSSFVFTCSVINFLQSDISDLKDALFFFLLLIDLSKAALLAHWALSSSSPMTAEESIAQGLSVIGPTITLDTIVETLLIGVGTLSGVRRLEILCCFGCMSAIVNFVVFMTFYPACLALIIELSGKQLELEGEESVLDSPVTKSAGSWQIKVLKQMLSKEEPNPVIQRVKLIMAAGLSIVHAHCRWPLIQDLNLNTKPSLESGAGPFWGEAHATVQDVGSDQLELSLLRWLSLRADQFVIIILLLALSIKFTFFDDCEEERNAPQMYKGFSNTERRIRRVSKASPLPENCEEERNAPQMYKGFSNTERRIRRVSIPSPLPENDVGTAFFARQADLRFTVHRTMSVMVEDDDDFHKVDVEDKGVQTDWTDSDYQPQKQLPLPFDSNPRSLAECVKILKSEVGAAGLTDLEVLTLVGGKQIAAYGLEKSLGDANRGVRVRRLVLAQASQCQEALVNLPYSNYDFSQVVGVCCENVIGYIPVPLGVAGPLLMDGAMYSVPLATTEGCLVASTNRGCRAVLAGGGVRSQLVGDGMSRGPVVQLPNIAQASAIMAWLGVKDNLDIIKAAFNSTSRFARLQKLQVRIAGRLLFIRFVAKTGDAMGMNMLSKGTEEALKKLQNVFPDMVIISLSGNYCTDKKPAAVNWIEGRGKSVVCEAVIPACVVESILKTNVSALVELNITKNLVGSAMAGSIGGFNAHAANIVTAIFIATGQDPAQNVESSNCMTLMERWGPDGNDLYISCSMPSIETGTLGGGTNLPAQASCLELLGVRGANAENPGDNSARLARLVCATVLVGELSLMSALAAGHLVKSHMTHNRSSVQLTNSA